MRQRFLVTLAASLLISTVAATNSLAQGPTTYTLTENPGFSIPGMGTSTVTVIRDGSKEVVDQIMPPGPGRDKEYHGHLLYDFQAHRLYTKVISDPTMECGAQEYNEAAAPAEFDVISGAAALMKEISSPDDITKPAGTEVVNGIPARVVMITSKEANAKVWYALKGGYPIKVAIIGADGTLTPMLEVKTLSFAKPEAMNFILPTGCMEAGEAIIGKPTTNITALTLDKIGNYTGPCPAHIKMTGTITVDGPGTVFYQFGAGSMEPGRTLTFSSAGTKSVTSIFVLTPKYGNDIGGGAVLEAIATDARGKHGIPTQGSNNSDFNITCTSGGGK